VRVGVIAEIGAGIQPQIEDLAQVLSGQASAAFVDEADYRNLLLTEGTKQLFRHGANRGEVGRSAIAAPRKVVNGDRNPPVRSG
jgi:hypothetical protein